MEQTNQKRKRERQPFTVWHIIGLIVMLFAAIGVWFGVHPFYRFVSIGILVLAAVAIWKRSWMWWIIVSALFGVVVFLWTFGQAGYRFTSMIPLAAILMMVIFRFCKKTIKISAIISLTVLAWILLLVEIPIVGSAIAEPKADAEYVIVLGAAVYGKKPSTTLHRRLDRAIRYLNGNPRAKAVVSGGQGEGEDISEAECMRRYLLENGIGPDRILTEDQSTSTKENLAFSKKAIKADGGDVSNVVIVSSAYHLYRAKKIAAIIGMHADGIASSDGYPIYMLGMYIREAFAVVRLWIFGT